MKKLRTASLDESWVMIVKQMKAVDERSSVRLLDQMSQHLLEGIGSESHLYKLSICTQLVVNSKGLVSSIEWVCCSSTSSRQTREERNHTINYSKIYISGPLRVKENSKTSIQTFPKANYSPMLRTYCNTMYALCRWISCIPISLPSECHGRLPHPSPLSWGYR